ncbi:MAG: glycosyltransferase, partial [Crenarchaeota archaeon]|nr:glycosyltransferase [Thermoproteota archaeon]
MNNYKPNIDILFINTIEIQGGAARAAYRIFNGIKKFSNNILYLTLFKESEDREICGLNEKSIRGKIASFMIRFEYYPLKFYTLKEHITFTPSFISNPFQIPIRNFKPKIVHLHWLGFSYLRIEKLTQLSCPIVWTLHDQWAFTGGCHYSGDCKRYENQCGQCPQLNSLKKFDITYKLIERKKKTFKKLNLTIVTPSQWLANLAHKSTLLKDIPIHVIPNGLDTQVFKPIDHKAAKEYYNFSEKLPVLLFSAASLIDPRKGSDLLIQALKNLDFPFILISFG